MVNSSDSALEVEAALQPFLLPAGRPELETLQRACSAGRVLEEKQTIDEPKVVLLSNGGGASILKVWYRDRRFSSARVYPYSTRFRRHAAKLRALGFNAPLVRGWGFIPEICAHYVCYEALPGQSLRDLQPQVDLTGLGGFVASLHKAGVDYRSLHLGNILWEGGDAYGLIDLTDCRFQRRPLALKAASKRLIYLCTHRRDVAFMREADRWADLLLGYSNAMQIAPMALLKLARKQANWSALAPASESATVWERFAAP